MRIWFSSAAGATGSRLRYSPRSLVSVSTRRSSITAGEPELFGRLTSMPRYIIGAVSMKISSSTSTTSTNGMMLISDSDVLPLRVSVDETLNAIADRHAVGDRGGRGGGPREEIQEVEREALHLDGPAAHAIDEVVV